MSSGAVMLGSYNYGLAALSVFIGVFASYSALDLAGRVTSARGWIRSAWLAGGATAMGFGIWSMHFTGMLAFSLPVPVAYDWPTVLLSLATAIFSSAVALYVVSRPMMGTVPALVGSVVMGSGIAALHYIGMAAMRFAGTCGFSPGLVTLSVVLAILFSLASFWLAFHFRAEAVGTGWQRVVGAIFLGAAISVMHYTGMAAASFNSSLVLPDLSHAVSISSLGTVAIGVVTLMVQTLAVSTSFVDRRFAAQSLELQTSKRFRQIADNLPIVLALANADFTELLYVNRTCQQIWGRTVESFYAEPLSFLERVHQEDRDHVKDFIQRLIAGHSSENLECRVVRPDGSTSWVACRGYLIRDAQGRPYRLVGSAHDITDRKRAEERLHEYEKAVEGVEEMIVVVDREYRYLLANRAFLNFRKMKREQVVGRLVSEVVEKEVFDRVVKEKLDECFRGNVVKYELKFTYPDWGERDLLITYFPVEGPAGVERAACVIRDITDRKRADAELRRLSGQLLRSQDEERRRIARELHDSTGQDLVALATTLSQLHASIPSSSKKLRKFASQCQALADRSIREVRTLSYLLHPPMLDEAGLGDAIRHYLDGFTRRTGINVALEISPRIGRMAPDLEVALFRVVQEGLTNIQRHSGSFRAGIRIDRDPKEITLEINDSGSGIFGSQRKQDGTLSFELGVGIPSMQERVRLMGGRLEIESRSSGTTVRVMIPIDG
jgi:PAS domain S-box-containing protein